MSPKSSRSQGSKSQGGRNPPPSLVPPRVEPDEAGRVVDGEAGTTGWARIGVLFHELVGRPRDEQRAALAGLDPAVAAELDGLLRADAEGSVLDGGAAPLLAEIGGSPEPEASPDEAGFRRVGERLGAWRLTAPLGRGGMGEVYLAERADGLFAQEAAVKVLRRSVDSPELERRFLAERQLLARLDHPGVARLLDGGVTGDGTPWFALERVAGLPITQYAEERQLSTRERVALLLEVCAVVEAAHRRLVVHRDLKPSNILVTDDGQVKLLDFGIAKVLAEVEEPALTRTEHRVLTPQYAAPEQILGEPVTTAVDLYALGVVLYELLTGARPHDRRNTTPTRLAAELARERTVPPSERARGAGGEGAARRAAELQGDLDAVVMMALRPEPDRRYLSVAALGDDLRRVLDHRPVAARTGDRAYRVARFVRRHRNIVTGGALLAASLLAGLAGTAWQARVAREHAAVAERRFADTRAIAHALLFEIHDAVRDLDGATAARQLIVQRALDYLERLAPEAGRDPELTREVAAAYERVGEIQGALLAGSSRGLVDSAEATLRRALALREALAAESGEGRARWEDQLALARTLDQLAAVATGGGRYAAGQQYARRQLEVADGLVADRPADDAALAAQADALLSLYAATAGLEGVRRTELVERALVLRRQLAGRRPSDPARAAALANALRTAGGAACAEKSFAIGLPRVREAVAIQEALLAKSPGSLTARMQLIKSLQLLGGYSRMAGEHRAALTALERAAALTAAAAAADPANTNLATTRMGIASETAAVFGQLGDLDQALANAQQAVTLVETLLRQAEVPAYLPVYALWLYSELGDHHRRVAEASHDAALRRRHLLAALEVYRRAAAVVVTPGAGEVDAEARGVRATLAERTAAVERLLGR